MASCLILFSVYPAIHTAFQLAEASSRHHSHSSPTNNNNFIHTSPSIAICCGWDNKFAGGQLTYSINGGDASSRQAVVEAVNEWASNVNGLQFTQAQNFSIH